MPNYKKMYFKLFNEITDAIERLKQAQRETEEIYVSEEPADLRELKRIDE